MLRKCNRLLNYLTIKQEIMAEEFTVDRSFYKDQIFSVGILFVAFKAWEVLTIIKKEDRHLLQKFA